MNNLTLFHERLRTSWEVMRKVLLVAVLIYMAITVIRIIFDSAPGSLFAAELLAASTNVGYLCAMLALAWLAINMLGLAVGFKIKATPRNKRDH